MARTKKKSASTGKKQTHRRAAQDAISLLKADHREVEGLFSQFDKTRSPQRKKQLASAICTALKVHTTIDGAKKLIAQIESSGPEDDFYDAKVSVLSEMIKHHVKEEEQSKGMFAEARGAKMDLKGLGAQLKARKQELMDQAS